MTLLLLFCSAFLAATLLPFYSEAVLVSILADIPRHGVMTLAKFPWLIWMVATLGNTLGAVFNWILGRYFLRFQNRKWFPFSSSKLESSQKWFQHYGVWTLLFAWLPIIGDAFTFIAGVMRVNVATLVVLSGIGKGARYAVLIIFADYFIRSL